MHVLHGPCCREYSLRPLNLSSLITRITHIKFLKIKSHLPHALSLWAACSRDADHTPSDPPPPAKERPDTAAQYKIQLEGTIPAPLFLKKNCHQLLFWLPRPTSAWGRPIQLPLARSCHRFKKSGSRLGAVCWIAPHWI